jgi:hypothetical protein
VPAGCYDRDRALWAAADNGRVVRLLDTDGDQRVDAVDGTGDGALDDLDGDGSVHGEAAGLDDPLHYAPDATFWRVAVTHFTPWDCNWPYAPPPDATPPNAGGIAQADGRQPPARTCNLAVNSRVDERSRILHEDLPLAEAQALYCYWAVRELDASLSSLAEQLSLTPSGVAYAVQRGERLARQHGYTLTSSY